MSTLPRGLYAITDTAAMRDHFAASAEAVLAGGAVCMQYRDKSDDRRRRRREAGELVALCRRYGVCLIVNDDVALALQVDADGVHLGEHDARIEDARRALGHERLIGISCYDSLERARLACRAGADYVAFGSFFRSASKPVARRATLDLLRRARNELQTSIVAIGGIRPDNGAALIAAGADALAVISGIFGAADPRAAARTYAKLFESPTR